ncbi:hypothetical protein OX284_016985 [Flavobacterium sp. SUN046]|uniref:hypothetical protein n=1 Tax=Flavobacterium sp. SUN046 TaxID=3002440 RepID=UPI002DBD6899|nr:hypothetical protein [Flavobacterium sp. SUN046]MEC4051133.1 hypothetical protein [Flavobacterium sp. SUN046]
MSLGYTWYPQDWWTSETFKRLKKYPLVRYTIRELFDLMYKEGKPIEMNRDYLIDDFNIELSDEEYQKLLDFIVVTEDGKWWINSIRKRLTKAESARENGKNGGRPKGSKNEKNSVEEKTQKPSEKTQKENPENPPLEIESKIESKIEINIDENIFIDIWKRARMFYDKKPCGFDKLISFEKQCFNQLLKDGFTKQDFEFAVAGLFFQDTVPAVRVRPDWLLKPENFEKMLDCWKNKTKIFSNKKEIKSEGKFKTGDV